MDNNSMIRPPDHNDLQVWYREGEECDKHIFAEQKSNILLVSSNHYASGKYRRDWLRRVVDKHDLTSQQKLRLTKNHIQRIQKLYRNNLLSYVPDVLCEPANPNELRDSKAAQLYNSVWKWIHKNHKIRKKQKGWAKRFLDLGEVFVKIFWDPNLGQTYETPAMDEMGRPVVDEMGNPMMEVRKTGDLVIEEAYGFNVLRKKGIESMEDSPFICIRKLRPKKEMLAMVGGPRDERAKYISSSSEQTYRVFDATSGDYADTKDQVLVQEWYFRPCAEYPNGWYVFCTPYGKLFEGELPEGIFPVVYAGLEDIETSPRHISNIRHLRPYQVEINRMASKIAEHQVTLGDDKIIIQGGAKITSGNVIPGVRSINVSGPPPTILEGKSGNQFLDNLQNEIREMYLISNIKEDSQQKPPKMDTYAMLFADMKEKKRFNIYTEKFEDFMIEVAEVALKLMKLYAPNEMVIKGIGTAEAVNIAEFKRQEELGFMINIDRSSSDITSTFGRLLQINHIMQYSGQKLQREDMGLMIRNMPFVNKEEIYSDLVMDFDNSVNVILALDRGEKPSVDPSDNHVYMIKRLRSRMQKADFKTLDPAIQQEYIRQIVKHENYEAENLKRLKQLENEFIPSGGPKVRCDYYVEHPTDPNKSVTAKIPSEALNWLIKQLEAQGSPLNEVKQLNPVDTGSIGQMVATPNKRANPIGGQYGSRTNLGREPR